MATPLRPLRRKRPGKRRDVFKDAARDLRVGSPVSRFSASGGVGRRRPQSAGAVGLRRRPGGGRPQMKSFPAGFRRGGAPASAVWPDSTTVSFGSAPRRQPSSARPASAPMGRGHRQKNKMMGRSDTAAADLGRPRALTAMQVDHMLAVSHTPKRDPLSIGSLALFYPDSRKLARDVVASRSFDVLSALGSCVRPDAKREERDSRVVPTTTMKPFDPSDESDKAKHAFKLRMRLRGLESYMIRGVPDPAVEMRSAVKALSPGATRRATGGGSAPVGGARSQGRPSRRAASGGGGGGAAEDANLSGWASEMGSQGPHDISGIAVDGRLSFQSPEAVAGPPRPSSAGRGSGLQASRALNNDDRARPMSAATTRRRK